MPNNHVAAVRATSIIQADTGKEQVQDIGDDLVVDSASPVSGDRCNVSGETDIGLHYAGSVPLADIAALSIVQKALAARGYNRRETTTFERMPGLLEKAIEARQTELQLDPMAYPSTVARVMDRVRLCSEVSAEALEAIGRNGNNSRANEDLWDKYHFCAMSSESDSNTVECLDRSVMVFAFLVSEKSPAPYHVMILFVSHDEAPVEGKTPRERMLESYDRYGLGNFAVMGVTPQVTQANIPGAQ